MKLSVIIPTMQKNVKVLSTLLKVLSEDIVVDEIILIDNSGKGFDDNILAIPKLRVVINQENKFVNPTWNQGISLIKNDYWAILNDDILLPKGFCSIVAGHLSPKKGIFGIDKDSVILLNPEKVDLINLEKTKNLKFARSKNRLLNFGIAMFGHKSAYYNIPEDILIWYGDDYLFRMNNKYKKNNFTIGGVPVYHLHSLTSGSKDVIKNRISPEDEEAFSKYFITTSFTFLEKMFSFKNVYCGNTKDKVLFFLGIKFVLYSKPVHFDIDKKCWVE